MSTATVELTTVATTPRVERVAFSVREVSNALRISETLIGVRCRLGSCAYLDLHRTGCRGRLLVLLGDVDALVPWGLRPRVPPHADEDGRATIRRAFPGRDVVSLLDLAAALGVSRRTLARFVQDGELRANHGQVTRTEVVRWLLEKRVPARWESNHE